MADWDLGSAYWPDALVVIHNPDVSPGRTPSLLSLLRASRPLRLLFVLTGLIWMLSAQACALHDVTPDCEYTAGVTSLPHSADADDRAADADHHVPCCPHPLGTQLPVYIGAMHGISVVVAQPANVIASVPLSFSSHTQTPPTPPPIHA